MRTYIFILLSTIFSVNAYTQEETPKSQIVLEINGEEYYFNDGQSIKLEGIFENPKITVRVADTRTLKIGSFQFDYPSHFAYQYDEDFGYRNWTLDGKEFVIMYFEFDEEMPLDFFIEEMVKQFGKQNCKLESKTMQLGDKVLHGKRINITLIGQRLTLDFMEIILNDSMTHFIAFQDTIQEDGSPTKEGKEAVEMIDETIRYNTGN